MSIYRGVIRIAKPIYGRSRVVVVDEKINIDNSLNWYDSLHDFAFDYAREHIEDGSVVDLAIHVTIVDVTKYGYEEFEGEIERYEGGGYIKIIITPLGVLETLKEY
ncbi:hypothetical protein KAR91_37575 [Candidatus Pacearchaeota archaeon]|nr:hypothetical protein [Candidatus Pacearchaeota archaeon]